MIILIWHIVSSMRNHFILNKYSGDYVPKLLRLGAALLPRSWQSLGNPHPDYYYCYYSFATVFNFFSVSILLHHINNNNNKSNNNGGYLLTGADEDDSK